LCQWRRELEQIEQRLCAIAAASLQSATRLMRNTQTGS
jgi:hypothetical protein